MKSRLPILMDNDTGSLENMFSKSDNLILNVLRVFASFLSQTMFSQETGFLVSAEKKFHL